MRVALFFCPFYFWRGCGLGDEAEGGDDARHEGADEIEEAEGQVQERGDAQDCALRHAACRPRHKDGGDGGAVFGAAAEKLRTVAATLVFLTKDRGVHDDGKELVTHNHIEEHTTAHRCGNQLEGAADCLQKGLREAAEHVARYHA